MNDSKEKGVKVAVTGATGNMGREVMKRLAESDCVTAVSVLSRKKKNADRLIKSLKKNISAIEKKIEVVVGSVSDYDACSRLIAGADYILHLGGVVPPLSDQNPRAAIDCNEKGTSVLVSAAEKASPQPKFLYISTVALYGNRNSRHLFGRVGDPLIATPFDIYTATKLRAEFRVMNSELKNWTVLRQTVMLHDNMLSDNISDGLMFHICFNAPLEWITAYDSGVLMLRIIERDVRGELSEENFWRKCFNVGGGAKSRKTGYETIDAGFGMIGGSAKDFFEPQYNCTRNFHGVWFSDSDKLQELFNFVSQDMDDYWKHIEKLHPMYKLGKLVPKGIIKSAVIKRLLGNYNAPVCWYKNDDKARLFAYFGGKEKYESISKDWADFPLLSEGKDEWGNAVDYAKLKSVVVPIDYGFDIEKSDCEVDLADLKSVASLHGGRLLTENFAKGDVHTPVKWLTQDGEEFFATPFSVFRGGHWYNSIYRENVWEFDRLSKKDRIFAALWYDSHDEDENVTYSLDENFRAVITENGKL